MLYLFQGHDLSVHKHYYRLNDEAFDCTKMGTLLMAMEQGHLSANKGESLDEFIKNYHEESDEEGPELDEEDRSKITPDIAKKVAEHFGDHIKNEKKPKRKEVKDFLLDQHLDEKIPWQDIRDRVWDKIKTKKRRAKKQMEGETLEKRRKKGGPMQMKLSKKNLE